MAYVLLGGVFVLVVVAVEGLLVATVSATNAGLRNRGRAVARRGAGGF